MKNILKRFYLVIQYVIFVLGIWCIFKGIEGKIFHEEEVLSGIGLLILGPILRYIFIGQFLIFPWSKEKEGSDKTRKEVLKRLLILTHYGIFLVGTLLMIVVVVGMFTNPYRFFDLVEVFFLGIGTWILGPTLNYIFLGKFLIFPWSIEKVGK